MLKLPEVLDARILIVDDEPANVQLLERVLAEAGYTDVVSTLSPKDVETLHVDSPFDLILLDLQMPGMDGFEVMARLGTASTEAYLPVIVLTAQPGHKLRALQAGARDFISKPFDLAEVKMRIRNMLEVRLLHKELARYNVVLEQTVLERTVALRESEERYRRLTQLASDWYWVQDAQGQLIDMSGPAMEMPGMPLDVMSGMTPPGSAAGWDELQRQTLQTIIDARQPFLDFMLSRDDGFGGRQSFRISGEPIFDVSCRFIGYRGVGVEFIKDVRAPTVSD
jgi:CheY-like chemotaxis protein